jgi:two-component system, OmpR family, sensor kinase
VFAAVLAAIGVTLAAWTAVRLALRPVDRMRAAAVTLPPGERLPVPPANDELRALAEELNELLARRDNASARLERFTGDAAHELRSPVAAIRAQAEVAVLHPDPALAAETLRSITEEATRLSQLLSDLMALARADAGARPPASPVDLAVAARAAIGRCAPDLGLDGAPPPGPAVSLTAPVRTVAAASPGEVGLVMDNLLANARRYARSRVRMTLLPAGSTVRLLVDDDGPGVPAEDRGRVFDRFTRLEADRGGISGGAGLGLALVQALVVGRGGEVSMAAAPGGGARVEVRWPAPDGTGGPARTKAGPGPAAGRGGSITLADDEAEVAENGHGTSGAAGNGRGASGAAGNGDGAAGESAGSRGPSGRRGGRR